MKNSCKICGAPCKCKYCSEECAKEANRINNRNKYHKKNSAYERFYVFYDKNDFVRYFGTARQLVEDGDFPTVNAVHSRVSKLKAGKLPGKVLVLNCEK